MGAYGSVRVAKSSRLRRPSARRGGAVPVRRWGYRALLARRCLARAGVSAAGFSEL